VRALNSSWGRCAPISADDEGDKESEEMRNIAAQRMTPAQLAEAHRLAREWKPKAER